MSPICVNLGLITGTLCWWLVMVEFSSWGSGGWLLVCVSVTASSPAWCPATTMETLRWTCFSPPAPSRATTPPLCSSSGGTTRRWVNEATDFLEPLEHHAVVLGGIWLSYTLQLISLTIQYTRYNNSGIIWLINRIQVNFVLTNSCLIVAKGFLFMLSSSISYCLFLLVMFLRWIMGDILFVF